MSQPLASTSPNPLALPSSLSPDDIDPLTELAIVLTKVRASIQPTSNSTTATQPGGATTTTTTAGNTASSSSAAAGAGQSQSQAQSQSQSQQQQSSSQQQTGSSSTGTSSQPAQQLSFKEVPGATDGLKHKLQRARAQVMGLPDMQRSIEEQKDEMASLEKKIAMQRALLERLREEGGKVGKDDGAAGDRMEM